ncbi:putative phosphoesterase, ICC [Metallosphaera yellowstonensis MK1]|uniref:Putative phosphoesterase, ICC n=2 Tax=Metallosphaera yellowstonensis MK1 TaxID=671065 RepID=H2C3H2_9CREN|nr:putative phosphoesterase, ICC [Metallosphaera yellowstonensis MK1]
MKTHNRVIVGLFKKNKDSISNLFKIMFTTDIHGSDVIFKKFLNAGKMYKVDALIIGGDIAGKALIPVVEIGEGKYEIDGKVYGPEGMKQMVDNIRKEGNYYVIVDKKGLEDLKNDKRKVDEAFRTAMSEVVRGWVRVAEEKLKDYNIPLYVNLGNDDPTYLFEILDESKIMRRCEGLVVELGGHEMISFGYVNPTPWNTPRELPEDEIYRRLRDEALKLKDPYKAIFNVHAPPLNTNLDLAPLLDDNLKPVVRGGELVMVHVGSSSVRKVIEEFQPLIGLHGHIHESRAFDKLGRTLVLNPGSEHSEGILHAAYVVLESDKVKAHQFIIG